MQTGRNPRLAKTESITLVDEDFATDNRREAAADIKRLYADGVRTFVEMEERGKWSRSLYQEVYHDHFEVELKDKYRDEASEEMRSLARQLAQTDDLDDEFADVYQAGFKAGIEWAVENAELLSIDETDR